MAGCPALSSLAVAVIKALVGSLTSRALATAALLALCAFLLLSLNLLQRLDLVIYDLHADLLSRAPHEDVRIVAIDDKSLQALGRWPWPREVHGELIEKLTAAGARAIGMDLLFNEADYRDPQSDHLLAEAMAASDRVVLPLSIRAKTRLPGSWLKYYPLPSLRMPLPIWDMSMLSWISTLFRAASFSKGV